MSDTLPILVLLHAYHNRGGVEEHARLIEKRLGKHFDLFFVYPEQGTLRLRNMGQEQLRLPIEAFGVLPPFEAPLFRSAFEQILLAVNPALIHVLHFVGWPLFTLQSVIQTGRPALLSLHDYYLITPQFTLQGALDEDTLSASYSRKVFGADLSDYLRKRRTFLEEVVPLFDTAIVPSMFLRDRLSEIFPRPYTLMPYGIEKFDTPPRLPGKHLRFGYFGTFIPQKGWAELLKAFKQARAAGLEAELHLFGGAAPAGDHQKERIFFRGPYGPEHLPRMCSEVDIGVIPSLFPETYSIVLSEMWHGGLRVAVSRLGALWERVQDGVNGRLFSPGDIAELAEVLLWFERNPTVWERFNVGEIFTAEEMETKLVEIYRGSIAGRSK